MTIAELGRLILRVEQKLDRVTDDHEGRLRNLEKAVWVATGLGGAAIASSIGALLNGFLS